VEEEELAGQDGSNGSRGDITKSSSRGRVR